MRRFERRGRKLVTSFEPEEVQLLESLVNQLIELLAAQDPEAPAEVDRGEPEDPFVRWERDLADDPDQAPESEDPVLRRLFPHAYPDDAQASADFRRFTEREGRAAKIADARVVLVDLAAAHGGRDPVKIPLAEADAWLRTLNNLRLSIATRLGITDSESAEELSQLPEDDPRAFMHGVYEWLAFAQETLVGCL